MRSPDVEYALSLLTNHGHVLLCIADQPDIRIREIAARSGITERAAHRIVAELEEAGFVSHVRVGRRNHYEVHRSRKPDHPLERHLDVTILEPTTSQPGGRP
ncbi:helix-turn-helix transcriptional regulator [Actinomycetota bacterium]|jgi:predicted DNA-binding transcriptional regulator